jgi:pyruvate dehydrogenase E2 component (dihydrolipoamide acetyltransferase)
MITRIVIPQLFENMEEATIGAWLKAEGDRVAVGEALCELITEKSTFELEAEADGVLRRIVAQEKSIVPVHFIIGLTGEPGDELPDVDAENRRMLDNRQPAGKTEEAAVSVPSSAPVAPPAATPAVGGRVRATPAARRLAKELGVSLEAVAAAQPGKVLSEDDVRSF